MQADPEFGTWQRQWQSQPAVPVDLRRRVERDMRGRRLAILGSVAVTVLMGGGTILWAAGSGDSSVYELAVAVWVFIAIAWGFTVRLERLRGPWEPSTETTLAFLDYAIRSRRARRRGIVLSSIMYVVFFGVLLVWRYRADAGDAAVSPWDFVLSARVIILFAISVTLGALAVSQSRRLGREERSLLDMRQIAKVE